jgi:hypothetical protein
MSTRADTWPAGGIRPDWTLTVVPFTQDESGFVPPLVELDDRSLVEACLTGRVEAFDVVVARHQRAVYLLCFRFVRRHEDAADLAQEVFLRAYRGLRRFRGDASLVRDGLKDVLVEPRRAPLISGFEQVKQAALAKNALPVPSHAATAPAAAGPSARDTFIAIAPSATACGTSLRPTRSLMLADCAGM